MPSQRNFLFAALLTVTAAVPAQIDRESNVPVQFQTLVNASAVDIQSWSAQGYRISNFEVVTPSPMSLKVSLVRNTGPYQASWLFVHDKTYAELVQSIFANNARPVDIETWDDNGVEKFSALLFTNTGQQQKAWHFHHGLAQGTVWSTVGGMGHRVIDLEQYLDNGVWRYHAISIANTGPDLKAWWVYTNTTVAGVQSNMQQLGARLYDFEGTTGLTTVASCVLVADDITSRTYWGQVVSPSFDLDDQMGGRVAVLDGYSLGLSCVTLIDSLDPFTEFGTGCAASNGTGFHTAVGNALTGTQISFRGQNLVPWTIAIAFFGEQTMNLPLAGIGMPGCTAYVDPFTSLNVFANQAGTATVPIDVPANPALHDALLVSQVVGLAPGLNALGLQATNGLVTRLRHW
ncbi:MAG: hypothetical protein JNK15_04270 [Planctomycetes bacterium]|nr:hypothetical protein [Planctomycetota bacterium]